VRNGNEPGDGHEGEGHGAPLSITSEHNENDEGEAQTENHEGEAQTKNHENDEGTSQNEENEPDGVDV